MDVLNAIANSPLLAVIGLIVVLALVFTPAVLSLAGLTGSQIIELLTETMRFVISLVKELRGRGDEPKQ